MPTKVEAILLHHTDQADRPKGLDWPGIRAYQMSYRVDYVTVTPEVYAQRKTAGTGIHFEPPDRDIAYNLGLEFADDRLRLQVGRDTGIDGAHTLGWNARSIGVCLVGDFDLAPPAPPLYRATITLLAALCRIYDLPATAVLGHWETGAKKSCPGTAINMDDVRRAVARQLSGGIA